MREGAKYIEDNYGDVLEEAWNKTKDMFKYVWDQVVAGWKQVLPHLKEAWETSKPYFHQLGKVSH